MGCYVPVLRRDTLSLSNLGIMTLKVEERGIANVAWQKPSCSFKVKLSRLAYAQLGIVVRPF